MQIKQLEYVQEIARQGNITRAAEKLYISQQTLSEILKSLENELGFQIFERTKRGVIPTEKGNHFLQELDAVLSIVRGWGRYREKPTINILLQYIIGDLLLDKNFLKPLLQYNEVEMQFETEHPQIMLERICQGECSIGIFHMGIESPQYQQMTQLAASGKYRLDVLASNVEMDILLQETDGCSAYGDLIDLAEIQNRILVVSRDMLAVDLISQLQQNGIDVQSLPRSVKAIDLVAKNKKVITYLPRFIAERNIHVQNGTIQMHRLVQDAETTWCRCLFYKTKYESLFHPIIEFLKTSLS